MEVLGNLRHRGGDLAAHRCTMAGALEEICALTLNPNPNPNPNPNVNPNQEICALD